MFKTNPGNRHLALLASLLVPLANADVLTITVDQLQRVEGRLMLQLVDNEAAFKSGEGVVMALTLQTQGDSVTVTTEGLLPGEYGIRVFHDRDGDGVMGSNMLGMPIEPWGMSNNALGNFGPPSWAQLKFTLQGTAHQTISLIH